MEKVSWLIVVAAGAGKRVVIPAVAALLGALIASGVLEPEAVDALLGLRGALCD